MRGRRIPLTAARKLVVDWMRLTVPSVPVQRVMDISRLVAARAKLADRPPWAALFIKAFGLVSADTPALRRSYVKLPRPHLFEYPVSLASFVFEREHDGEDIILIKLIRAPEDKTISAISEIIRQLKAEPVEKDATYRRMVSLARLPMPLRRMLLFVGLNLGRQRGKHFGTFGISVYSGLGAESLHPLSPLTALLNYGVIDADGRVAVRIVYDHRVLDGANVAGALARLEERLNGDIVGELEGSSGPSANDVGAH